MADIVGLSKLAGKAVTRLVGGRNLSVGLEMRVKKSGDLAGYEAWLLERRLTAEHCAGTSAGG